MMRLAATLFVWIVLPGILWADCAPDYRSEKESGLFIADLTVTGTASLSSVGLAAIRGKLVGACVNDSVDDLEEIVSALFLDQGYFAAKVNNLDVKILDPLAQPKRVALEADVAEGPIYRLAEIRFIENRAFTAAKLRDTFSLHKGDIFKRKEIAGGFQSVRKLYATQGFRDLAFISDTDDLANATVVLTLTMMEGTQYHMGKLRISAKQGIAEQLQSEWKLSEGSVFDFTYPEKYVDSNKSLLPGGFTPDDLQLIRNCPEALVEVRILVDQTDPALRLKPPDVKCEKSNETSK